MAETPFESKVGVFAGDSLLDDMEGWGEELMLRRACAADGGCPKLMVEIIRASKRRVQWLPSVVGMHWTRALVVEAEGAGEGRLESLMPGGIAVQADWRQLAHCAKEQRHGKCAGWNVCEAPRMRGSRGPGSVAPAVSRQQRRGRG